MAISLKALSGVLGALIAGMLVLACWPRLEPSAMHMKAAVEQPVFVTPLPAPSGRKAQAVQAIARMRSASSRSRCATSRTTAERASGPGAAWRSRSTKAASLARKALSPSPRATSQPHGRFLSAPPRPATPARSCPRRHIRSRDAQASRRHRAQGRQREGARLLCPRARRGRERGARAAGRVRRGIARSSIRLSEGSWRMRPDGAQPPPR